MNRRLPEHGRRYYFRLLQSMDDLLKHFGKLWPSERQLAQLARKDGFNFNEKNVRPALYENLPFADGLAHSLTKWLETDLNTLIKNGAIEQTLETPVAYERNSIDYFMMGAKFLSEILMGSHHLRPEAFLKDDRDVKKACNITLECLAAENLPAEELKNYSQAELRRQAIENHRIAPSEAKFFELMQALTNRHKMSVLFAVTPARNKVGVTSVLPLTDRAYDQIRSGKRPTASLTPDDIALNSNSQLTYICANRVDGKNHTPIDELTKWLASTLYITVALQALPKLDTLRVLSIGGTPRNCDRLVENGYSKVGINEADTDKPLYEIDKKSPYFNYAIPYLRSIQAANR